MASYTHWMLQGGKPALGEVCEEAEMDTPPPEQDRYVWEPHQNRQHIKHTCRGRTYADQQRARRVYVRHLLVSGLGLGPP